MEPVNTVLRWNTVRSQETKDKKLDNEHSYRNNNDQQQLHLKNTLQYQNPVLNNNNFIFNELNKLSNKLNIIARDTAKPFEANFRANNAIKLLRDQLNTLLTNSSSRDGIFVNQLLKNCSITELEDAINIAKYLSTITPNNSLHLCLLNLTAFYKFIISTKKQQETKNNSTKITGHLRSFMRELSEKSPIEVLQLELEKNAIKIRSFGENIKDKIDKIRNGDWESTVKESTEQLHTAHDWLDVTPHHGMHLILAPHIGIPVAGVATGLFLGKKLQTNFTLKKHYEKSLRRLSLRLSLNNLEKSNSEDDKVSILYSIEILSTTEEPKRFLKTILNYIKDTQNSAPLTQNDIDIFKSILKTFLCKTVNNFISKNELDGQNLNHIINKVIALFNETDTTIKRKSDIDNTVHLTISDNLIITLKFNSIWFGIEESKTYDEFKEEDLNPYVKEANTLSKTSNILNVEIFCVIHRDSLN